MSRGHIDTIDYLITDCACNPNIKGYQGRTLLHYACGIGNAKMVTTLIEKYCFSPMATDAVNQTPLHIAASHGQEEVVRLLITPRACARGKACPSVVVVVGTKIAKSRVLGVCACCKHSQSVDIGEKLVCMCFEFLKKAY